MASSPTSPISTSPVGETALGPFPDDSKCPKFRILIVGRSGTGKSSLINAIFKASLAHQAAAADVNKGITSDHNKYLVIHESEGYEPDNWEKFHTLKEFIEERSKEGCCGEKLHAIWLCITAPASGGPTLETWDEKIFELNTNEVPIIVVYTKFDLVGSLSKNGVGKSEEAKTVTERNYKEKYGQVIERSMKSVAPRQIPYTVVTTSQPESLQRLVEITAHRLCITRIPSNRPS
ncbi:hypothetical protein AX14_004000 [Amanita brunnescens Koide BX004]|nr:hypothetical protein AX14_004000 [Amanita brunnescens Koide BX004]